MRWATAIVAVLLPYLVFSQGLAVVWNENFNDDGIGYWSGGQNMPNSLTWTLNVDACSFVDANDYVKTVSTGGGRLEARDCKGEAVWTSDTIFVVSDSLVLSLDVSETGSGSNASNKYVSVSVNVDGTIYNLPQNSLLQGNFGKQNIEYSFASSMFCIISIKILTGYSSDKLIIDNILLRKYQETEAQTLSITSIPLIVPSNESFSIEAVITDTLGNRATTFNGTARIEELNSNANINNGLAQWNNLQISSAGLKFLTFIIEDETFTATDSLMVINSIPTLLSDDFSSFNSNIWQEDTAWIIADKNGESMLQHNPNSEGNENCLWTKPMNIDLVKDLQWQFEFQNGNWDPSSSNKFAFVLLADNASDNYSGVACGVNIKGSDDLLKLWQIENGKPVKLLSSLSLDVNANMYCKVYVGKNVNNEWWLCAEDSIGNRFLSLGEQFLPYYPCQYAGFIFRCTATRRGLLWFDNIKISGSRIPFALENVTVLSENKLLLTFNEDLATQNFTARVRLTNTKNDALIITNFTQIGSSSLELSFDNDNSDFLLTLHLQGVESADSHTIDSSLQVIIAIPPKVGELIISEIYAQADSSSPLPNSEYVEIVNLGDFPVLLDSCQLRAGSRAADFQMDTILPNEYKVLVDMADSGLWSSYEDVICLQSMPSLSNTGALLSIYNALGDTISSVEYSNKWHSTTAQRKGWALERIDLHRDCGHKYNWTSSTSAQQGTPAKVNSVDAPNQDNTQPKLLAWEFASKRELKLTFSEAIQYSDNEWVLKLTNNTADSVLWLNDSILFVVFQNDIPINRRLTITFNPQLSDLCNNELESYSLDILNRKVEAEELLITEILYDPYSGEAEFIELYNESDMETSLKDIVLAVDSSLVSFDIDSLMQPEEYYVLTKNVESVLSIYYTPHPENCFDVNLPSLPNSGATIRILNTDRELVAESPYSDDMHSQLIYNTKGVSLTVNCIDCSSKNLISSSSVDAYATPSYFSESLELTEDEYTLTPKVFSPDNDGIDDILEINYKSSIGEHSANIRIYNSQGREVAIIANNEYVAETGEFTWNGRNKHGGLCNTGVYIVVFELYSERGGKAHKKLACTLIRRKK